MAKAKGTVMASLVKFLRANREAAIARVPESLHPYLETHVDVARWYPEEDTQTLIQCVADLIPGDRQTVLELMATETAKEHLRGIYEHLATPDDANSTGLRGRTFALWATMHDTGELTTRIETPGHAVFELRGYVATTREMCTILVAYFSEGVRLAGMKDVRGEKLACILDGADCCRWSVDWTE